MATSDGLMEELGNNGPQENMTLANIDCDTDDDEDDGNDETWDEMDAECDNSLSCLFCVQNFKTIAVALEHCKVEHNFNLSDLKNKFNMDCYSYICMINYVRREGVTSEILLSFKEPPWLNNEYLAPVIQDDPWLMFDFDGFESPTESRNMSPVMDYHVVNSENGLVTLTEQHFAQLQHKIKHLTMQVQNREEALVLATEQIDKMKAVTQNLVCSESVGCQNVEKKVVKISSNDDDGYFCSYSHFGIHHEMLSDRIRTNKYRNAICNNGQLFDDKIVLDVGCGTGILSMFAASAGARKVFGIDKSDIIFSAMDIVRENNLMDKIDLKHAKIEDVSLPIEKVDIIISEWMGYFLLYEGMLDSLFIARDKFLKPGGLLLPNRCLLYLTGISDSESHSNLLGFWSDVYGFKMSCLQKHVIQEVHIMDVKESSVITSSSTILNLDLYKATSCIDFQSDFFLDCNLDGQLTGLCGYFDAVFDLPNKEVLSTSPMCDKTHWKQAVFFLENPISVTKGSVIKGTISCKRSTDDNRALTVTISIDGHEKTEYFLT